MVSVTIICDASYCSKTHAAGYGFWAVSERGRHAGGGSFKALLDAPSTAETMAIVNALHVTLGLGIALKGDRVLIQTDCIFAIHMLTGVVRRPKRHPEAFKAVERFNVMRDTHGLSVDFRHVKGHTTVADNRSKAQRMSDFRAKQAMKRARSQVAR